MYPSFLTTLSAKLFVRIRNGIKHRPTSPTWQKPHKMQDNTDELRREMKIIHQRFDHHISAHKMQSLTQHKLKYFSFITISKNLLHHHHHVRSLFFQR